MRLRGLTVAVLVLAVGAVAQGPSIRVDGPTPSVVTLGASSRIVITVDGRAHAGDPRLPRIDGATAELLGRRSQNNLKMGAGGRMVRESFIMWAIDVTPSREGVIVIPPIEVTVDGGVQRTRRMELEVVREMSGQSRSYVSVTPSARRLYVHEPLRFHVDYGIDMNWSPARRRGGAYAIDLRAPWLSDMDGAVPLTSPADPDGVVLLVNGEQQRVDYTPRYPREGRQYHRFQFDRTFLPSRVGMIELSAPILAFEVVTREGVRNFFGEARNETEVKFAYGDALEIEVLPLPEEGRPTPYFGGVGRFTIAATASRRQVKVGNSVVVELTIEGIGNTEFLRVPELDDLANFHLLGSKIERTNESVVATYDLTPLSVEVTEIPAIEWNFFDTTRGVESYQTLRTAPIPLVVLPLAEGEALSPLAGEEPAPVTPGVDDIYDMKPASSPPVPPSSPPSRGVVIAAVAAPWGLALLISWALAFRRRRRADLRGSRARGAAKTFRRALTHGSPPAEALVGYLADRLDVAAAAVIRADLGELLQSAGVDAGLAAEAHAVVERGVAARYGGDAAGVDAAAVTALVARLEGVSWTALPAALATLLCLVFLPATAASQDPVHDAEAAYRRGDYVAAGDAFAAAAAVDGADRRLYYNLGNSLFRQGRLGEALLAYERARRAMPRDADLLANIRLVRQKLQLSTGEGEPFLDAVADLRRSLRPEELFALAVVFSAAAAFGLVLFRRRWWIRSLGWVALLPAVLLTAELLWFGPARLPAGVVIAETAAVVAEPRGGLEPVLTLREGAGVEVLSSSDGWMRVRVDGRTGYVVADAIGVVD